MARQAADGKLQLADLASQAWTLPPAGTVLSILPIELPCTMDAFGIVTREGHLLSPGARQLLQEIRVVAKDIC